MAMNRFADCSSFPETLRIRLPSTLPMYLLRHLRVLLFAFAALGQLVAVSGLRAETALPPAPSSFILDRGNVLLPGAAATLSQRLRAAAEERGIWVYVVTLPSLGVPPSKQRERLVNMGDLYRSGWLGDRVGVVLLVDDESGAAMVAASDEANRRYPPLQRNILLEEPLRLIGKESLQRDKIEKTALAVVDVISRLQDEERQAKQRDRRVALSMGSVISGGVALLLFVHWKRRKSMTVTGSESNSKPTNSDSLF